MVDMVINQLKGAMTNYEIYHLYLSYAECLIYGSVANYRTRWEVRWSHYSPIFIHITIKPAATGSAILRKSSEC